MYTLHRMYQRLLHPTKLYQATHTVPLVYLYVPVHFLPVIYIPSTSRLSTGWTLKAPCTFSTRTVHTHSSRKLPCIIATTSVLTIFSTKTLVYNHYLLSTYMCSLSGFLQRHLHPCTYMKKDQILSKIKLTKLIKMNYEKHEKLDYHVTHVF